MKRNFSVSDALNQYSTEERSSLHTFIFVALLIGLSVWGFTIWLGSQVSAENHMPPGGIDNTEVVVNEKEEHTNERPKGKALAVSHVKLDSELLPYGTNVPISFRIEKTNPSVKYIFDFGDGVQRKYKGKALEHAYHHTGEYKVTLKAYYKNKKYTVWKKDITIIKGVDVMQ